MITLIFLRKKYVIFCFPSPGGRGYWPLWLCEVGVMIILPHLAEGGLNEFVFWALEMGAFMKAIPAFLEVAHMNRTHMSIPTTLWWGWTQRPRGPWRWLEELERFGSWDKTRYGELGCWWHCRCELNVDPQQACCSMMRVTTIYCSNGDT